MIDINKKRCKKKKNYKSESMRQENLIAEKLNGERIISSGALPGFVGDVRITDFLVEAKTTCKDRYYVNEYKIKKIEKEALNLCLDFALIIFLKNRDDCGVVLIPYTDSIELSGIFRYKTKGMVLEWDFVEICQDSIFEIFLRNYHLLVMGFNKFLELFGK